MIIWCWKTGEKLVTVNTYIRDEVGQILRVTQIGPSIIAQMGKTCGRLFTWEFDIAGQIVVLKGMNSNENLSIKCCSIELYLTLKTLSVESS